MQTYFHALLFTSLSDMDCNLPTWDYYLPVNVHVCICCQVRESIECMFWPRGRRWPHVLLCFVIDASLCCRLLGRLDWGYTFPTPLCDPFASKVFYPLRRDTEILRPFLTLLFLKKGFGSHLIFAPIQRRNDKIRQITMRFTLAPPQKCKPSIIDHYRL